MFDKYQQAQIQKGKALGIDVSKYSNENFSHTTMYEIRKGLEQGVDITPFAHGLSFLQLREVRFAMQNKIDAAPLIKHNFSVFQMRELRLAIQARLDITPIYNIDIDYLEMRNYRQAETQKKIHSKEAYYAIQPEADCRFCIFTIDKLRPVLLTKQRFETLTAAKAYLSKVLRVDNFYDIKTSILGSWKYLNDVCIQKQNLEKMLTSPYLKQNQGYFIIQENERHAFAYSPTAPSPFVLWDRKGEQDYFFGVYRSEISNAFISKIVEAKLDINKILQALHSLEVAVNIEANEEMEI